MSKRDALVLLDLNNPTFQDTLFALPKPERHSAVETLKKIRQLSWPQLCADRGLKWEKITSVTPPAGIDAVYSCACRHRVAPRPIETANICAF